MADLVTKHKCQCSFFSAIPCASPMTQEDMLCDPCREFKTERLPGGLHFTDLADPSPHETLKPRELPLKEARSIITDPTTSVRMRISVP